MSFCFDFAADLTTDPDMAGGAETEAPRKVDHCNAPSARPNAYSHPVSVATYAKPPANAAVFPTYRYACLSVSLGSKKGYPVSIL